MVPQLLVAISNRLEDDPQAGYGGRLRWRGAVLGERWHRLLRLLLGWRCSGRVYRGALGPDVQQLHLVLVQFLSCGLRKRLHSG